MVGDPGSVDSAMRQILGGVRAFELESSDLDFKRPKPHFDACARDLAEAAACFANARGGTVVVGIDDKASGSAAFVGCPHDAERLRHRIWELTLPSLTVSARSFSVEDMNIVEFGVPQGFEIHTVGGRAAHRVGADCVPMSASEQARTIEERRGIDWSAGALQRRIGDCSPLALEVARGLLRNHSDPQRQAWARLSDPDMLRALGLATADGLLLRAGELLFCDDKRDLIVYQLRLSPGGEPTNVRRFGGPLLPAIERMIEIVSDRIERSPILLPSGQQIDLADLPERPVREAIVNALAHRDWRIPEPIAIEQSPALLVVNSPGPLVPGVTVENILAHPSKPRNLVLTEAVRKLGLAEQAGVGVDRMYRDMIRGGHRPPTITDTGSVRVSLVGGAPNKPVARYIATLPPKPADDVDAMLVLFTLLSERTVTAPKVAPLLQKPVEEAQAVLRELATDDVGMLETTRQTASRHNPTYRFRESALRELGTAVSYRRRTADEIDRKVIATVREIGKVTNGVLQALFDVRVERASRILADLVEREILIKTSAHERGPGVTYGPGPAFPKQRNAKRRERDDTELEGQLTLGSEASDTAMS